VKLIVSHRGRETELSLERDRTRARVQLGDDLIELDVHSLGATTRSILWNGRQYDVSVKSLGDNRFEVSGEFGSEIVRVLEPLAHLAATAHRAQSDSASERVDAYMPGRVVQILVEEGEAVPAGHGILVLEAMKMENEIQSERAGTIRRVFVTEGAAVEGGDPLYEIE
jgi:biotin carboxyl carrier protein